MPRLEAGDIGSVSKLTHAITGDTLTAKGEGTALPRIEFPEPVFRIAVHPKSKADLEKLSSSLTRLTEEDPSLVLNRDHSTGELIIAGMGDSHVDVMAERAKRKFGVELELSAPRIGYQETISKVTNVEYKHKKQSGGHGQYGHVFLRLEPRSRGEGFEFASEVVGGTVPREYIPAVEKGVHKTMEEGALAGFPIVDVRVVLTDGSSHAVDSSGQSFEIAGSMAMKKGVVEATPTLLEPVMHVTIDVPEHFAGGSRKRSEHAAGAHIGDGSRGGDCPHRSRRAAVRGSAILDAPARADPGTRDDLDEVRPLWRGSHPPHPEDRRRISRGHEGLIA